MFKIDDDGLYDVTVEARRNDRGLGLDTQHN